MSYAIVKVTKICSVAENLPYLYEIMNLIPHTTEQRKNIKIYYL